MRADKRKSQRKSFDRRAWIDSVDGSPLAECVIGNMSDKGAKLVFESAPELPGEFILRLSVDGRVARKCRMAWTSNNDIGVQFVARLVTGDAAGRGRTLEV
jgi:PilZ domain